MASLMKGKARFSYEGHTVRQSWGKANLNREKDKKQQDNDRN